MKSLHSLENRINSNEDYPKSKNTKLISSKTKEITPAYVTFNKKLSATELKALKNTFVSHAILNTLTYKDVTPILREETGVTNSTSAVDKKKTKEYSYYTVAVVREGIRQTLSGPIKNGVYAQANTTVNDAYALLTLTPNEVVNLKDKIASYLTFVYMEAKNKAEQTEVISIRDALKERCVRIETAKNDKEVQQMNDATAFDTIKRDLFTETFEEIADEVKGKNRKNLPSGNECCDVFLGK